MARKKDNSQLNVKKNTREEDASSTNNEGTEDVTNGADRSAEISATTSKRSTSSKRSSARKHKGNAGQQMSLTEEEARQQHDAPPLPGEVPPAGVKGRGSSRRSAGASNVRVNDKEDVINEKGAAPSIPSGRSPDQKGDDPNEAKIPAKRKRNGNSSLQNTPIDPEHETPPPASARKSSIEERNSPSIGDVPPPVVPGEIAESGTHLVTHADGHAGRKVLHDISLFTDFDIHLFREGKHHRLYEKLGAHVHEHKGVNGTVFAVWAPNAEKVSVMGDFNEWDRDTHPLKVRDDGSGIWEGFVPEVHPGMLYKYHIKSRYHMYHVDKSDPFAFAREAPPQTASVVADLHHQWHDQDWMTYRNDRMDPDRPYSVYEMHVGSWRRKPEDHDRPLTYRELAQELPAYLKEMGFTHVEFMPVMYHPFNGSWGYQVTGYFAAASQYGSPQDLMYLIDTLHQHNIGVIFDWVPSHFPGDEHGLIYFDGTHLFEHADMRKGFHPDWNSYIFNYGRNEVRSFLISNALFWLEKYHVDGLRVDAVASMLYLDYSRKHGEWIPNEHGGRENLEAVSLFQELNKAVHASHKGVVTIAEESTAWPGVTASTDHGGLGFDMKWMMGWMHDTLRYLAREPIHRKYHQGEITFSIIYAFSEKFMLPLSHDEVVHGKGSLLRRMPGDDWQRFANLRMLYGYMFGHPGKKLLFMGAEFGMHEEWNHDRSLDWHLLQHAPHAGVQHLVRDLNHIYLHEPSLHAKDLSNEGFEWIDHRDEHNSVMSFVRKGRSENEMVMVICNFTPVVHHHYRLGAPARGQWEQIFTSDHARYGGSGFQDGGSMHTMDEPMHGRAQSLEVKLPPLGVTFWKYMG